MTTIFYLQKELIILHHRVNVACFTWKIQLSKVRNKINTVFFGPYNFSHLIFFRVFELRCKKEVMFFICKFCADM